MLNLGKLSWWLYKGKVYFTEGLNFLQNRKALANFQQRTRKSSHPSG